MIITARGGSTDGNSGEAKDAAKHAITQKKDSPHPPVKNSLIQNVSSTHADIFCFRISRENEGLALKLVSLISW